MIIPRFFGSVCETGKLVLDDQPRWLGLLGRLRGRRVVVTLAAEKKARSLRANRYLWGVVYEILSSWSGHDPEEIHEAMKARYLPKREITLPTGEVLELPGSTAALSTADFAIYIERVKAFAAQSGCYVPAPNEVEVEI